LRHTSDTKGVRPPSEAPLHVTNGDSAAITLRQTPLGGDVLAWRDALCEGPLPPTGLNAARARFLAGAGWGEADAIRRELDERDATLLGALRERPVVLWFEHDLYDQLQLLQVLALVAGAGGRVELIQADRFLGELEAAELEALWHERRPVTDAQLELAVAAWRAVRHDEELDRDTSALPFLGPALRRLQEHRPRADGVSRSERQLLEPLLDGPRTPAELFLASQAAEEARFDGDTWAFARIARLEGLLAAEDGAPLPAPPPRGDHEAFVATRLILTDAGRRALRG
jgi:hypothetical protein